MENLSEQLVAVFAVILGWLLSEFSTFFRDRGERRRRLGEAVATLLMLRGEMQRIESLLERFKSESESWAEFERQRVRAMQRYPVKDEQFRSRLAEAESSVALVDPVLAYQLGTLIHLYGFLPRIEFRAMLASEQSYVTALSALEVAFTIHQRTLLKIINKMAMRMGIGYWLRLRWTLRKEELQKTSAENFSGKVWEQIMQPFERDGAAAEQSQVAPSVEESGENRHANQK